MSGVVHYSKEAERDLDAIAAYTLETWGAEQLAKYLDILQETCEVIVPAHVHLARETPGRPGLLRWRVERHVVYFRTVEDGIEIVRILHARMLPSRHL